MTDSFSWRTSRKAKRLILCDQYSHLFLPNLNSILACHSLRNRFQSAPGAFRASSGDTSEFSGLLDPFYIFLGRPRTPSLQLIPPLDSCGMYGFRNVLKNVLTKKKKFKGIWLRLWVILAPSLWCSWPTQRSLYSDRENLLAHHHTTRWSIGCPTHLPSRPCILREWEWGEPITKFYSSTGFLSLFSRFDLGPFFLGM